MLHNIEEFLLLNMLFPIAFSLDDVQFRYKYFLGEMNVGSFHRGWEITV